MTVYRIIRLRGGAFADARTFMKAGRPTSLAIRHGGNDETLSFFLATSSTSLTAMIDKCEFAAVISWRWLPA